MPLRLILGPNRVYEFGEADSTVDKPAPEEQISEAPARTPIVLGGLALLGLGLWAMSRNTVKDEDDG